MKKILRNSWALFMGMAFIMIAYGFQGSLLGVRAVYENFSLTSTGFMMSGYFVGYFIGANTIPKFINDVGHIRVFAAFASAASLVILLHSILVSPFIWFILRIFTGISMVCIYTVAESWLNDRSTNKNRGKVLSVYMIVLYTGLGIGMFFLNFSTPQNYQPFILVSVLMSLALIPILLTKRKAPKFKRIKGMKINELYKASPLGMVSSFCTGTIHSALFTLLAVYAVQMNFTIFEISLVTFMLCIAGTISQWPIGYVSDKLDRRLVIVYVTFGSALFAFCAILSSGSSLKNMYLASSLGIDKIFFYCSIVMYAFCSLPMFSLNLSHTNDYIEKENFVPAGAGLQFVFGLGAIGGPLLCSIFMTIVGSNGFFIFLIIFHIIIGIFGIYRMKVRPTRDNPDAQFVAVPATITPAGLELNPTTEPIEENNSNEKI